MEREREIERDRREILQFISLLFSLFLHSRSITFYFPRIRVKSLQCVL
jgi:hypothetical protein